ncbi:MAG: Hsp20/alpha crystallin family protein, partial [Spirochaetales bacterium]|nr:Hsp20/alpha crystallin family protein [Spirochaetales bacterium]
MKYVVTRRPNYLNLFDDFDKFFDGFWNRVPAENRKVPSVDIQEDEKAYVLDAELPGYEEKDIDVHVEDHILTIESRREDKHAAQPAEKEAETENQDRKEEKAADGNAEKNEAENRNFLVRERRLASFRRSFKLPEGVDEDSIQGEYKNGILHLEIPKKAKEQPKKIAVKIA